MTLIEAINDMLGTIGEAPIDEQDPDYESHPLYQSALRILNRVSKAVQSQGWWFNTYTGTLASVAGAVALASDVLTVMVVSQYGDTHDYAIRDGALFDLTDNTATIPNDVTAVVRTLVAFAELPETAASYITAVACTRFVKVYDGDAKKIEAMTLDERAAYIPFNTDHIRNSRVNLYATQSMGPVLANNWYSRYRQR